MSSARNPIFDADFLCATTGIHDKTVLDDIYQEFISNVKHMLDQIENDHASMESLFIAVHNNKSSSRAIGAIHLADTIDEYEPLILDSSFNFNQHKHKIRLAALHTIELIEKHLKSNSQDAGSQRGE